MDVFLSEQEKDLQQIFQGQSDIKNTVQLLHEKLNELIGRQERTLSLLSSQQVCKKKKKPPGSHFYFYHIIATYLNLLSSMNMTLPEQEKNRF